MAYAGEPGAFAEDAVIAAFGAVERTPLGGFRPVFEAVTDGRAVAGVVPIENVINGTVRENYDLLLEFDLEIRGEVVVPVQLCLAALPGQGIDDIERVYSHIQALGQAEAFLRAPAVAAADHLQHGRCRQGDRRSRRARRGGRAVAARGRPVRAGGAGAPRSATSREPDPVRRPRPARMRRLPPLAIAPEAHAAHDPRRGRPQRARHAPGGAPHLRGPRAQHEQARVATRAASAPGSTSSGSTSTPPSRMPRPRPAWPSWPTSPRCAACSAATPAPRPVDEPIVVDAC